MRSPTTIERDTHEPGRLVAVEQKIQRGERLTFEDGVSLYASRDVFWLGKLAEQVTLDRVGPNVYYSLNRHMNYTNICKFDCKFCGFKRWHDHADGYTYEVQEVVDLAQRAVDEGATEIHIVGGIHPDLPFAYYIDMIGGIRVKCPGLHIKAFTTVEILDLSKKSKLTIGDTLTVLMEAGLDSLPGGGAEILDDDYFKQVCRSKSKPDHWEDIHRTAHQLGLMTNCTMLYGFIETTEQRIKHLLRLRSIQDDSLAKGQGRFQCFIPLPYLKPRFISKDSDEHRNSSDMVDAMEDLKTIAISRLILDNVEHHKAFWPMQGVNLSQVALTFGADDLDGTVKHYTIVDKGFDNNSDSLGVEKIRELIVEAGRVPVQRDGFYQPVDSSL